MERQILINILFVIYVIILQWWAIFRKNAIANRFYYSQIKNIINKYDDCYTKYNAVHSFDVCLYLFYIGRLANIWLAMQSGREFGHVEVFGHFSKQASNENDSFFPLIGVTFLAFAALLEPIIYMRCPINTITLQKYNDLVVRNYDFYLECANIQTPSSLDLIRLVLQIPFLTKKSQRKFKMTNLVHFDSLSLKLRVRFVKIEIMIEFMCKIIFVLIGIIYFLI